MVKSYSFVLYLCTILLFGSKSFATEFKEKIPVKKDTKTNTSYINSVTDPGWSYTCKDGIEVELISQGIKNNIPAELTIPETGNVERLVIEIVYKGKNPGATINIEDADGNLYSATREVPAGGSSNVWYYRTELPATSKVKYTNTFNKSNAQSMLAYVFRKKNSGLGSSGTFTAIGGYNNVETVTIPINTDDGPRTVGVELPISELTPDGRYIHIEVSAADGSYVELTENINSFPSGQCCIKVFKLALYDVAGTVDEIEIKIDTRNKKNGQSVDGQSWVMGGSVKTDVYCSCVKDDTPPEPDVATLDDLIGECSVEAPTAPTATDNCAGSITGTTTTVFPVTTPGSTIVTWTFTDPSGNSSTQTQEVIVNDALAPVANVSNLADITDECSVSAPNAPTATDNCDGTITGTTTATFPITTPGTTIVTWTFTDIAGNSSTQTQNIIIEDLTAPTPDATSLVDITNECSVSAPTAPTATDNCDGTITGTTTATFPITMAGTTVVTWTFTDSAGNSSTQTQNIIIEDLTAPTPDAASLADLIGGCSVPAPNAPTATDNCDGIITGTTTTTFPITMGGTTVVTWNFTDSAGNSSTQTQNIIIEDDTAPIPDAGSLADLTDTCSVSAPTPPTASDNCDLSGPITGTTTTVFPVTTQGTTVITWTFTDAAGNSSTQTQNAIINDVTPPTPDNLEDHILAFDLNNLPEVTFSDNCSEVTEEYNQYYAKESCWAGYGPLNQGSNIIFNSFPFDKFHHWEEGYFQKFEDGTAKVHGRVVNNTDTTSGWIIEIFFERLVDFTTWTSSGGTQPGDPLQSIRSYANVDFSKPYTLDGFGSYAGANLTLLNNTPHYMDIGPRDIYGSYGMGFQISYEGSVNGQAIGGEIDQFIEMISSLENCIYRRGILVIREWTVTDAAGNTAVYIQRVELEE